jgi:hypothetical protein
VSCLFFTRLPDFHFAVLLPDLIFTLHCCKRMTLCFTPQPDFHFALVVRQMLAECLPCYMHCNERIFVLSWRQWTVMGGRCKAAMTAALISQATCG